MTRIAAEVEGRIPVDIETVFDVFAPIDLTTIMTGYGPLPACAGIEDQDGAWDGIGQSRIIRLADGGGMLETLTAFQRPTHFAYTINELTNVLRFLVKDFHGAWFFEDETPTDGAAPSTHARWRYEFVPHSVLTWPLSWVIVKFFWRPYMAQALALASAQAVDQASA